MDDEDLRFLSDRSQLGHQVHAAAVRISRRRMFADLSQADRDDLISTAIEKYYATWGPLGEPDSVEAWLSTVMYRAMVDHFRRQRRLQPHAPPGEQSIDELLGRWLPPAPSLSTPVVNRDAREEFLALLSPADARLLCLKADGFSHREIGEVLGIRANAVDVRLHRLRIRLREMLVPDENGENELPPHGQLLRLS
jgi:RNA polymerase sigma-70 factor (ECF subfamily)